MDPVRALPTLTLKLPEALAAVHRTALERLVANDTVARLWARDKSLWTGADEDRWLGWLGLADDELARIDRYQALASEVRAAGYRNVLLLGMGGSSLCPDVLRATFGQLDGFPALHVLDSTDPAQVRSIEARIDLARTLFIVASKSGSTLEPSLFFHYFLERTCRALGEHEAPRRFVAITDPGSKLEAEAKERRLAHIFSGVPSIGGRYSALSAFGLVPAAAMGLNVRALLERARDMARACGPEVPGADNPALNLGALLGSLAAAGRDKLTLATVAPVTALGAWIEQLVAESTGKLGRGIIPVDREPIGASDAYGSDRVFVSVGSSAPFASLAEQHPVASVTLAQPMDLFAEMFRWEMATAVVGVVLGINPFDQPDVEASKLETRKLTSEYERTGKLPDEDGIRLDDPRAAAAITDLLAGIVEGDYFALLAYIEMSPAHESALTEIRELVRDRKRVATCLGFGPRFLHSTGQAYKGGPASGVFLQLTADPLADLAVPGAVYGFAVVQAAQAAGDLAVLKARGRRALRVQLGSDILSDLYRLRDRISGALATGGG